MAIGQRIMLVRVVNRLSDQMDASDDDTAKARLYGDMMHKCLNLAESLIIEPDDAAFVEAKMLDGTLGYLEVLGILGLGKAPDDDDAPVAPRKVTRAPAKRVAKKAPAKTANARRTKK